MNSCNFNSCSKYYLNDGFFWRKEDVYIIIAGSDSVFRLSEKSSNIFLSIAKKKLKVSNDEEKELLAYLISNNVITKNKNKNMKSSYVAHINIKLCDHKKNQNREIIKTEERAVSNVISNKNMDIALINIPYGENGEYMLPLGVSSLGAFLEKKGISVCGYDFSNSNLQPNKLIKKHNVHRYPIIGISFYDTNASYAYEFSRMIKKKNPMCIIIAGGSHATACHEQIMKIHPEIDIIVRKEGEETLIELTNALIQGKSLKGISGITHRIKNKIHIEPDRDTIEDLNNLPTPIFKFINNKDAHRLYFYDKSEGKLKKATAIITSRSCPFSCSFCAIITMGRNWRACKASKVIEHIKDIEKANNEKYEHIYFLDANFFVNVKRVLDIAEALSKYRKGITFSFSTRVNQLIKGKNILPTLKQHGLRAIELGVESGSTDALMRIGKNTKSSQNEYALKIIYENNIQLILDFIFFDAEATLDDLSMNIYFFEKNNLDFYLPWDHIFSNLIPYTGTEIRKRYEYLNNKKFDFEKLPEPSELFQSSDVRRIFEQSRLFKKYLTDLENKIKEINESITTNQLWNREAARKKLNLITLRRIPFLFMRKLILQAKNKENICFKEAIPVFNDDSGNVYSIEEYINAL